MTLQIGAVRRGQESEEMAIAIEMELTRMYLER
jgi:hypothetical protein